MSDINVVLSIEDLLKNCKDVIDHREKDIMIVGEENSNDVVDLRRELDKKGIPYTFVRLEDCNEKKLSQSCYYSIYMNRIRLKERLSA